MTKLTKPQAELLRRAQGMSRETVFSDEHRRELVSRVIATGNTRVIGCLIRKGMIGVNQKLDDRGLAVYYLTLRGIQFQHSGEF